MQYTGEIAMPIGTEPIILFPAFREYIRRRKRRVFDTIPFFRKRWVTSRQIIYSPDQSAVGALRATSSVGAVADLCRPGVFAIRALPPHSFVALCRHILRL